ncbi:hypothetical protein Micbo1qcDRAFT_168943 [Microdochium bolleyi]|uniref:Uncharacterized protein n=1 Tax=Microdochium bolleyi TaxID=196109 RepID=A0A136ILV5_9PEZI|nr:hypothetical protein Micbo1qcDRAFT_168943 [Microdochium bolleyi]
MRLCMGRPLPLLRPQPRSQRRTVKHLPSQNPGGPRCWQRPDAPRNHGLDKCRVALLGIKQQLDQPTPARTSATECTASCLLLTLLPHGVAGLEASSLVSSLIYCVGSRPGSGQAEPRPGSQARVKRSDGVWAAGGHAAGADHAPGFRPLEPGILG